MAEKAVTKVVDFGNIEVENIESKIEKVDFSKQLGNIIYSQSKDLGEVELAREIYNSGRVVIGREKADIILKYTEGFPYPVREAFKKAVEL